MRDGAQTDQPLAAVIPLDDFVSDRLLALQRFVKAQRRYVYDQRLTRIQRHRLANMLRALDGRAEGASQYAIAVALFGQHLLAGQDWSSSSFRYLTARLLRDGSRMVDSRYRQLLRSKPRT